MKNKTKSILYTIILAVCIIVTIICSCTHNIGAGLIFDNIFLALTVYIAFKNDDI
jgi:hypothetical protein